MSTLKKMIIFTLVIFLFSSFVIPIKNQDKLNKHDYQIFSKIINEIININNFYSIEASDDKFLNWKLDLDQYWCNDYKKFILFSKLSDDIGNSQFEYDNFIYNKKTIAYYQLECYTEYYSDYLDYNDTLDNLIRPSQYLKETYSYYQNNIKNQEEKWDWVNSFMKVINFSSFGEEYISSLYKNNYSTVIKILSEYLGLADYFLSNDPAVIKNTGYYYANFTSLTPTTTTLNDVFGRLYNFSDSWSEYLNQEEKDLILNFVIPKYQNNPYADRIYSTLK